MAAIVKLKKPITVGEGDAKKTIDEIDLSGLDALTGKDVLFCRREAARKTGEPNFYGIADDAYRLEFAAKATGIAAEVLTQLSAPDFEEVDQVVKIFLSGAG